MLSLVGIQLDSFDRHDSVYDDVFDACHEMLFNFDSMLPKLLIQVLLKALKAQGVSVFMLAIIISIFLKAVISQMNIVILIRQAVVVTRGTHVALFVNVKLVSPCEQCPNSQVKLPPPVKHGLLNVLLHDPESIVGACEYELLNVLDVPEDLYAFTLIECSWFHEPNVVLAMFER